ncbi:ABC transporter substrate-binding protein [Nocardioides sp.]|uniref:ABC transporter substrate-binding protein n=1 Tax=Nocardioides sp. TaxID=35761 RepID=UPI0026041A1A|nr:ABC transporter substrate-binding protein [Nocardioides sp.]
MPHPRLLRATAALAGLLGVTLLATGCGSEAARSGAATSGSDGAGSAYPVSVRNCGATVTFDAEPERVVLLKSSAVPYLHGLGVLDRVTARAGSYPRDYYDAATQSELDAIPLLTDKLDTSGHLQISKETVLGQRPDLVLGEVDNLSRSSLSAVGLPLIEEPALCASGGGTPSFASIEVQYRLYGAVFDAQDRAESAIAAMRTRLEKVKAAVGTGTGRTAAVLYPTVGGGTTYAYGTASMADPQLRAAGLVNVFGDVKERVFEVTVEELLGRDPDVLILLHSDGDAADVTKALTSVPGAAKLTAVRNGDVMTQLFNFTEPPTPLAVDGLQRIVERFGTTS